MKKIISILIMTFLINTIAFAEFSDIDEYYWGYNAIQQMAEAGILSGYPDGSFRPANNITLAEYASIFSNFFNLTEDLDSNYFIDISENHWGKSKIEAMRRYIQPQYDSLSEYFNVDLQAVEHGINANMSVTREIVIYSLDSILSFDETMYSEGEEKSLFADYDKIAYPKSTVVLYKNGIINGELIDGEVYIRPERYITRAEISAIFSKLLDNGQKIANVETLDNFNDIIKEIVSLIKEYKFDEVKGYIYDSKKLLTNIDFESIENKNFNTIISKYYGKLKYDVIDYGFDSYNKAHVVISKSGYNYDKILQPLKNITIDQLNNEGIKTIFESVIKIYSKEKLRSANKVETINFIKSNNEWKIVL